MKHRTLLFACVAIAAAAVSLTGCVQLGLSRKAPEKRMFAFDVERADRLPPPAGTTHTLLVRKFSISPRYERQDLVYRKADSVYESDFYSQFLVPPSALITEETMQWLGNAGLFKHVTSSATQVEPSHILEGSIPSLYGDYADTSAPVAVVDLQFFILRNGPDSPIVFQDTYRARVPIAAISPNALVAGFNRGLRDILMSFEADLRQALR